MQQACSICIEIDDIEADCTELGKRQHIFDSRNPVLDFLNFVGRIPSKFDSVVLLAHNMNSYDGNLILKETFNNEKNLEIESYFLEAQNYFDYAADLNSWIR